MQIAELLIVVTLELSVADCGGHTDTYHRAQHLLIGVRGTGISQGATGMSKAVMDLMQFS